MGVFYMMSVLQKAGVPFKIEELATKKALRRSGPGPKKNRKIFGNGFDKAQKCAIVYITRLIRSYDSRREGVILERAHGMDGVEECRGSVLLKGVREENPEIFEKSIDKHKIDAILDAPSSL